MKVSVFIATSLDGFIAREDGSIDWLEEAQRRVPKGEDLGYAAFSSEIDILVMGRGSFEKVMEFDHWPYSGKKVHVLSSKDIQIPNKRENDVSSSSEPPKQLVERLSSEGMNRLYVDGGITIQRFLREKLITDMTITVIPILLGKGKPLFGSIEQDVKLTLLESRSYDFGFVQCKYSVLG